MKTNSMSIYSVYGRHVVVGVAIMTGLMTSTALANPIGGVVAAGSAVIVPSSPKVVDVNQSSNKAVINWSSFNIAPDETTNFNQPAVSSVTLNRIGDANPSQVLGSLNANGQLMLVNPNGVFFGPQSKVDTASLVATTADITNDDFMNGKYAFAKAGNPNAQVVNNGDIKVDDKGFVVLAAPTVANNGVITANMGKVALAGSDVFTIDLVGDKLINYSLPKDMVRSGPFGNAASASNHGSIFADQGKVQLTAKATKAALQSLVNMDGLIQARSSKNKMGSVYMSADNTNISGKIDVSSIDKGVGGNIEGLGKNYLAFTGDANAQGGDVGGNGGYILMQGKTLKLGGTASAGAPNGKGGRVTFKAGKTFDVGSSEAYTIGDAVSHGGTTSVIADNTITVNSEIDGHLMETAKSSLPGGGYPGILHFGDGDANGNLTVNLNAKIKVPDNVKLTGDGTKVNVTDEGSIQNGVDVASTAGADIAVYDGTYDENVNVYKNNINLHSAGGSGYMPAVYSESFNDGGYGKPVIDGYVNMTADNDTVNGFKILGGELNGKTVGVNVEHGYQAQVLNNHIALGEDYDSESVLAKGEESYGYGGNGHGTGVRLKDAQYAMVKNNTITGVNTGVSLNDSDRGTVDHNKIYADKTGVDVNNSSNVGIWGNQISGNAWDDGYHPEQDALAAKNGYGGYGSHESVGVNADKAANIKIGDNTIKNVDTAIKLKDSANAELTNNTMSKVTNGVLGNNADNLVYDNNKVTGRSSLEGDGMFLQDSSNAKLTNNTHDNVKNKLRLFSSNATVKTGNNF